MQEFGQLLLFVSFFVTLATALTAIVGAVTRNAALMRGARSGLYAATLVNLAMSVVLTHGFLTHDFSNKYIAAYSDTSMPTIYLLASFWGGEKGALLFWVTSLSIFSSIAVFTKRERSPVYLSWVVALLSVATLFFLMLMVFESSPFETFLTSPGPADGQGLNPLLQNPVMAFHPPALLTGFILFTIPFAFGMAALITNRLDEQWITDTRRWTIVSWTFLTIGLLLGARWAYMEIGWGFWWMWDPVENAGLIPWFTATAFLHSVMIQERRGMLKRWNIILLGLTFLLCIFATFLTRSQLIVSIHAFADSQLPNYFFGYMIAIVLFTATGVLLRWQSLRSEARIESLMSRESMFVLNNVVLVFCAFVVLWGTLMGKMTESPEAVAIVAGVIIGIGAAVLVGGLLSIYARLLTAALCGLLVGAVVGVVLGLNPSFVQEWIISVDNAQVWDENKFNEIFVPIGIALLVLMGVGPLVSWRRATAKNFRKNFVWPLAWASLVTAVVTGLAVFLRIDGIGDVYGLSFGDAYANWAHRVDLGDWLSVVVYFLCAFVLFSVIREFHVGTRVRRDKSEGGYLRNLLVLTAKNPRRYGGYIVHIGVVFMFIAFTGKAFQVEEKDRLVAMGDVHVIDSYSLSLVDRDRFWSEEEGCVIDDATFVVLPLGNTVADAEVDDVASWLERRDVGTFHVSTEMDSPKVTVRFQDAAERARLLTDAYLARKFLPSFDLLVANEAAGTMSWTISDTQLVKAMPSLAMETLREARDRIAGAGLGATADIRGGSLDLGLRFADPARFVAFRERLARLAIGEALDEGMRPDGVNAAENQRTYRVSDRVLLERLVDLIGQSGLGASAGLDGERLVVAFADDGAFERFEQVLRRDALPSHVLAVLDNPELGAIEVIDARTGVRLKPESRFYPRQGVPTTEVAISGADFLVDVYVSMQPSEDGAYVKLYTVIFPLVNFLWIGGMLLLFGSVICLIPRWLARTFASMLRAPGGAAVLFALALGAGVVASPSPAAAQGPEPFGFAPPAGGDALVDILGALDCACPELQRAVTRPPLSDAAACACPGAATDREVVRDLLSQHGEEARRTGRAKFEVLRDLVGVDPSWDLRFRFDEADYEHLRNTTKNTCSGEQGMTLAQSKSTCSIRSKWMPRFRLLLTAGVSTDDVFTYYVAENNALMGPARPWTAHDLRTSEETTMSYGLPLVVVLTVLAGLGGLAFRNRRRRQHEAAPEEREARGEVASDLSRRDRLRLEDELDGHEY